MIQFDAHLYFEKEVRDKMKLTVDGNYAYSRITSMQHMKKLLITSGFIKLFLQSMTVKMVIHSNPVGVTWIGDLLLYIY